MTEHTAKTTLVRWIGLVEMTLAHLWYTGDRQRGNSRERMALSVHTLVERNATANDLTRQYVHLTLAQLLILQIYREANHARLVARNATREALREHQRLVDEITQYVEVCKSFKQQS